MRNPAGDGGTQRRWGTQRKVRRLQSQSFLAGNGGERCDSRDTETVKESRQRPRVSERYTESETHGNSKEQRQKLAENRGKGEQRRRSTEFPDWGWGRVGVRAEAKRAGDPERFEVE